MLDAANNYYTEMVIRFYHIHRLLILRGLLYEDNFSSGSYYEVQKLVDGLSLPYQMIDICINNYMIYYKFCQKPCYQETSKRVSVPY